jgi:hypothetical protein
VKRPRQLSDQATKEFKAIYRKQFGQDLSDDHAQEMGLRLLNLFKILLLPQRPAGAEDAGVSQQPG